MKRAWYRSVALLAILLLAGTITALPPVQHPAPPPDGTGSGSCIYWYCSYRDDGGANCLEALWQSAKYAKSCKTICDGPNCWCEYQYCYLV